jgi:hypothetical protein
MDEKRKPRKKAGAILIVAVLLLLPVLYVASAGPALAMVSEGKFNHRTYRRYYSPVDKVAALSDPTFRALRDYQEWCGAEFFGVSYEDRWYMMDNF